MATFLHKVAQQSFFKHTNPNFFFPFNYPNPSTTFFLTLTRRASSSSSPVSTSSSRLVSEHVINMQAIDARGYRHPVRGLAGKSLLRALQQYRLIPYEAHRLEDLYACSAECQVRIPREWIQKLPPRSQEEFEVLQFAAGKEEVDPTSRLSCQIVLERDLDGMVVYVPELQPWDTP